MALTSLMDKGNAAKLVEMLIKTKTNFDLYASNYTLRVVAPGESIKFIRSIQSNRVFAAFRKLEADVKKAHVREMDLEDVTYFQHDFKHPLYVEKVCNIDLKSCYNNILFRENIISKQTFEYISKLEKRERLAAIGMLASRKEIFTFKNGEVNGIREERSENSRFFFFAVQKTFEMMSELKKICGNAYLFTWVDGIYFLPDPGIKKACTDYLKEIKFPYSTEMLEEFEVKFLPERVNVTFRKDGDKKMFNLPIPDSAFKKALHLALLYNRKSGKNLKTKIKQNEKSKNYYSRKPR